MEVSANVSPVQGRLDGADERPPELSRVGMRVAGPVRRHHDDEVRPRLPTDALRVRLQRMGRVFTSQLRPHVRRRRRASSPRPSPDPAPRSASPGGSPRTRTVAATTTPPRAAPPGGLAAGARGSNVGVHRVSVVTNVTTVKNATATTRTTQRTVAQRRRLSRDELGGPDGHRHPKRSRTHRARTPTTHQQEVNRLRVGTARTAPTGSTSPSSSRSSLASPWAS